MSRSPFILSKSVSGWRYHLINMVTVIDVIRLAIHRYGISRHALSVTRDLARKFHENRYDIKRLFRNGNKFYRGLTSQGWPSKAFDRYVNHLFNYIEGGKEISLHSVIFAFTNSCSFQCEHCVEWNNLNKNDSLSAEDMLAILEQLHKAGVAQVLFSGGEPLNRIQDLLKVLHNAPDDIDYWIFTNGYKLTKEKAAKLKSEGLTGVLISLDDYREEAHDLFRGTKGSYSKAVAAINNARESGLLTGVTLVATNAFTTLENITRYIEMAKNLGVEFIQFLEPEAEGKYKDLHVALRPDKQRILEDIYKEINFKSEYKHYPIITYYPYLKRLHGCAARGEHFLYIDADGDVQTCPFCKTKQFSALSEDLSEKIRQMRNTPCLNYSVISEN